MDAVKFEGMNAVYGGPGFGNLPAKHTTDEATGRDAVVSVWKPSAEDLEILNNGGCVCLDILGGQPPVAMWTEKVNIID